MSLLLSSIEAGSVAGWMSALEMGEDPNLSDANGRTPLHLCGLHKALECAALLVDRGARVDVSDEHGNQPLWTAVMNARGDYGIVDLLMKHGADPHHVNAHGRSPAMIASQISDGRLIAILGVGPG